MDLAGTSGDDTIAGSASADTIRGGGGDDLLNGGSEADAYIWARGDGHDAIVEEANNDGAIDRLVLEGVDPSDLTLDRNGVDVTLVVADSASGAGDGGSITLVGGLEDLYAFNRGVEQVVFQNGTIWTPDDLRAFVLEQASTSGDDAIVGFNVADTLDGGAGDDLLDGREDADVYIWSRGDGHDVIAESGVNDGATDTLVLDGIDPGDIALVRAGVDVTLIVAESASGAGDGGSIRLTGALDTFWANSSVEQITFGNGSVWTPDDIKTMLLDGAATAGDDTIRGFDTADTIVGGGGDDLLIGGDGDDTYVFNLGDGNDVIREDDGLDPGVDVIQFGAGIEFGDLTIRQTGSMSDLHITIAGSDDSITVDRALLGSFHRLEGIRFADGGACDYSQIIALSRASTSGDDEISGDERDDELSGAAGDDILLGRDGADTLTGGAGQDTLRGGTGDDVYVFERGDGNDYIEDRHWQNGEDSLVFGPGVGAEDLLASIADGGEGLKIAIAGSDDHIIIAGAISDLGLAVETIRFVDGGSLDCAKLVMLATGTSNQADFVSEDGARNALAGLGGADTLSGGDGADTLLGGKGNDLLQAEWGDDTYIFNRGDGRDVISDYAIGGNGSDVLKFGAGISVDDLIVSQAENGASILIRIDGSTDQVLIRNTIDLPHFRVETIRFDDGTMLTFGQLLALSTTPTAGDDKFNGDEFANLLAGASGADTLSGRDGADTLIGGKGNDLLQGEWGDDTYIFNRGDGRDVISDYANGGNGSDVLKFGAGISVDDLIVSQVENGASILIRIEGSTDQVLIRNTIDLPHFRVETIRFDDGTMLTHGLLLALSTTPTAGDDKFNGDEFANLISGAGGADTLSGRDGADTLIGGAGNDLLQGEWGDDTYIFNLGAGRDVISDYANGGNGSDVLQFGAGISADDLIVSQVENGESILIRIDGATDQVLIRNTVDLPHFRIETIRFDDGTTLTHGQLLALSTTPTPGDDRFNGDEFANLLAGAGGADTLSGRDGADTLIGGAGDDLLQGEWGDDTYIFNRGDGRDVISDYANGGNGSDVLKFGAGITVDDLIVSQAENGASILIRIDGSNDQLLIRNAIVFPHFQVETIQFDDGTTLSHQDLTALI